MSPTPRPPRHNALAGPCGLDRSLGGHCSGNTFVGGPGGGRNQRNGCPPQQNSREGQCGDFRECWLPELRFFRIPPIAPLDAVLFLDRVRNRGRNGLLRGFWSKWV